MLIRRATSTLSSFATRMPSMKAACVIIGDEVLNGKITDTNSRFFAKYCYNLGLELQEISTIGDRRDQIISTIQRLSTENDFIVTSGGIGSTHDDITYEAIASGFGLTCKLDVECQERMRKISQPESKYQGDALKAFYRMATLPEGPNVNNYYVSKDLWVPIVSISKKVYILPGIPQLYEKLLTDFAPTVKQIYGLGEERSQYYRRFFVKTRQSESQTASYLRDLQSRCNDVSSDIKIGSYPHFGTGFSTVSILGLAEHELFLKEVVKEVCQKIDGTPITAEMEQKYSDAR
ncbi:LAMI_0G09538g1_1 [Lachancea mirantina]|uniref:LAMI_0G09538g1_1 n=1 Tax=Lachancea mirantina TaxID=1230905 RepID=A0A1G4KAA1_9SACH|nr:LAMI_0G09538g1_1 [Lachancea mirantina]